MTSRDRRTLELGRRLDRARTSSPAAYSAVLEEAIAHCEGDEEAAEHLDLLDLHSELCDQYDLLGRVEDALRHADALVEGGYESRPPPRCRRAEILTRHGRLEEAAELWTMMAAAYPEDVWVVNNAALEYAAIGHHETALDWSTRALELALRTGDPERLLGQLRRVRAESLAALDLPADALQTATPVAADTRRRPVELVPPPVPAPRRFDVAAATATNLPVASAWLPREEYAAWPDRWPDLAGSDLIEDPDGGAVDHATYSWRMERRLRDLRDAGATRLFVAPLRQAAIERWLDADPSLRDLSPSEQRSQYAAQLARDPAQVVAWPPGRNDGCWCRSGAKYKKCCGAPTPARR